MKDTWNPSQYRQFENERTQPFFDLLSMVHIQPDMSVIDLGCGTGELTARLHAHLGARSTVGVDNSSRMLEATAQRITNGLTFQLGDIAAFKRDAPTYDLIFSNAALNWVEDHHQLLVRLADALKPGGQLAVQVPMNEDHPAYQAVGEVASRPEFISQLDGGIRVTPVQPARWYEEKLAELGFAEQSVRVQIYGHRLESASAVLEWIKGTVLNYYEKRLPAETFRLFVDQLRDVLVERLPDSQPYFFSFARLLIWGRK